MIDLSYHFCPDASVSLCVRFAASGGTTVARRRHDAEIRMAMSPAHLYTSLGHAIMRNPMGTVGGSMIRGMSGT